MVHYVLQYLDRSVGSTGLRTGEAIRLTVTDVQLDLRDIGLLVRNRELSPFMPPRLRGYAVTQESVPDLATMPNRMPSSFPSNVGRSIILPSAARLKLLGVASASPLPTVALRSCMGYHTVLLSSVC